MKHLTWSVLQKIQRLNTANYIDGAKSSILDVCLGSEYVSDHLEVFFIILN